jgi:HEAT repeat protein
LHHADARVRWQAVKVQVKLPAERDEALALGLQDHDPRTLRLALGLAVALQSCPDSAVPALAGRALDRSLPPDVRTLAVRALGYARTPAALEPLLRVASAGRTLFGRQKLPPKSSDLLAALAGLASAWQQDPRASAVLRRAAASSDPDIQAAADAGGRGSEL